MGLLDAAYNFARTGGWLDEEPDDPRLPSQTPLVTHVGQAMREVPFEQMLTAIGKGIANAQYSMDMGAMKVAQLMAGFEVDGINIGEAGRFRFGAAPGAPKRAAEVTLLELGFTPMFYAFTEAKLDLKVSMNLKQSLARSRSTLDAEAHLLKASSPSLAGVTASVSMVDVRLTNQYSLEADATSSVSTRLVSRPPPASLSEALRAAALRRQARAAYRMLVLPPVEPGQTLGDYVELLRAQRLSFVLSGGTAYSPDSHASVTGFQVKPAPGSTLDAAHATVEITITA